MLFFYETIQGYIIATLCFLILSLFLPRLRQMRPAYLSTANIIVGVLIAISVIWHLIYLFSTEPFYRYRAVDHLKFSIVPIIFACLTILPSMRRSIIFSILLVMVNAAFIFRERIYVFITRFFPDYLPSSWSYDKPFDIRSLVFPITCFAICYLIFTRLKATYKS